jgi:hypothetical protein
MAQNQITPPPNVVERNLALTADIMRYLMSQPQVLEALPDKFELVILPEDDPEIRLYNLELLDRYGSTGKPLVFARLKSHPGSDTHPLPPSLFVPVAA